MPTKECDNLDYTWEDLKQNIPKMRELSDEYGVRGLAEKLNKTHPAILYHLNKNSEKKFDEGDHWRILDNNTEFTISKDKLKKLRRDYCGADLTINQVCTKHNLLRWKFKTIKKLFDITHSEPEFTKEEMMENNIDDLAELAYRKKKNRFQTKLIEKEKKNRLKELQKYWQKDYYFNLADEASQEFWFNNDIVKPQINVKPADSGFALEVNIPDLHLARLCWEAEVDENYDRNKAAKIFMETIEKMLVRVDHLGFDKIFFPVGNDFTNFDNIMGETTAGTPQDNDSRWQKMIITGQQLLVQAILRLSKLAPVDVFLIAGNHDLVTSFQSIRYLKGYFRNSLSINIDYSPRMRKYRKYGKVLLGWAHGDKEGKRIFGLMQQEVPKLWGATKYREWHLGHEHKRETEEKNGVIVRKVPSIAAKSSWEWNKGYMSLPGSRGFVYEKQRGLWQIIPVDRL